MAERDPRIEERDICGIIHTMNDGCEWICVRKPHDMMYKRRKSHNNEQYVMSNNPQVDFHYMVPLYPQREKN